MSTPIGSSGSQRAWQSPTTPPPADPKQAAEAGAAKAEELFRQGIGAARAEELFNQGMATHAAQSLFTGAKASAANEGAQLDASAPEKPEKPFVPEMKPEGAQALRSLLQNLQARSAPQDADAPPSQAAQAQADAPPSQAAQDKSEAQKQQEATSKALEQAKAALDYKQQVQSTVQDLMRGIVDSLEEQAKG